jgi:hypothetical protein
MASSSGALAGPAGRIPSGGRRGGRTTGCGSARGVLGESNQRGNQKSRQRKGQIGNSHGILLVGAGSRLLYDRRYKVVFGGLGRAGQGQGLDQRAGPDGGTAADLNLQWFRPYFALAVLAGHQ